MTITTAKLPRVKPGLALLALLLAPACHAQWKFTPQIGVTQTFTDNIGLSSREYAQSQWVSQVSPGFTVAHDSQRLKLNGSYQFDAFTYLHGDVGNTRDSHFQYQAAAKATVIDDTLFVDASAARGTHSISAFGPQVNNNLYVLGPNRTDISTWRISPYLRHQFGINADLTARYTRDSVDAGVDLFGGSSEGESIDLGLASGRSFTTIGWGLRYKRDYLKTRRIGESTAETAAADLSYRLFRTLSLTASGGYDRYDYVARNNDRTEGRHWMAGFDWTPSLRTRLQVAGGQHFYGETWSLAATHRSRRSVWSASYSDAITNSRSQFLLPGEIDTVSMVEQLFRATIQDPTERWRAVSAYMETSGLPLTMPNGINYLSNRFMRQKQAQAAAIFNGPRADLVLNLYDTRRVALSTDDTNFELLGTLLGTLNDNVHQTGAGATLNYRITPRSIALAGLTFGRSRSLTTGIVDNNQVLRVGLTRQLGNRLTGAAEARHVRGSSDIGSGRKYHENAISATLTMQL